MCQFMHLRNRLNVTKSKEENAGKKQLKATKEVNPEHIVQRALRV